VLGYKQITEHPTEWNLVQEQKTRFDATRPDGSLGFFTKDLTDTRVVIELKSADTDLDAKQHRKHDKRSPVEQAFSYVPKSGKKCDWIIVSNYVELRFYHKNSLGEYESFRIADLTDEAEFKRFYYLLSIENLIAKDGESVIDALYRRSEEEEKNISKKFYTEYTQARLHLFEHLKRKNPGNAPVLSVAEGGTSPEIPLLGGARGGFPALPGHDLFLLEKTQKLLDRFIFVCFCEDTGMLPARIFRKVVKHAQESFAFTEDKIWTEVKGLFRAIDQGSPAHGIHGFDGELFKPDPDLDALHIGDDIFHELANITDYDFDSDLNVNILGHIFEQSISDLEELRAGIEGKEIDRKKGKRKKEGIFYTPEYITRYIVENAVGGWLEDRKQELGINDLPELNEEDYASIKRTKSGFKGNKRIEQHRTFWEGYKEKLMNIKVLDPACGSGAFLNQAFDFLHKEGQRVNDALAALSHGQKTIFDLDKHILSNNLYGVDLNRESVEITKLSLWLKTANKHSQLTALDDNIKCGNSLIDDPAVAGEKAFKWEEEFPDIMHDGGFDVVIGNPPYAGRSSSISEKEKIFVKSKYVTSEGKYELYQLFIEKCISLIKPQHSYVSLITPQTWLSLVQAKKLRKKILSQLSLEKIIFLGTGVFEASVDTIIFSILSGNPTNNVGFYNSKAVFGSKSYNPSKIINITEIKSPEYIIPITSDGQSVDILTRIASQSISLSELGDWKDGIKVVGKAKKFAFQYNKVNESFFPMVTGSDIDRYFCQWNGLYCCRDKQQIIAHDASDIRLREEEIFKKNKILIRKTGNRMIATIDENKMYYEQSLFSYSLNTSQYDLKYILVLLNSKLSNYILKSNPFSKKETFPQIRLHWLKDFPVKTSDNEIQKPFIEKADEMLELNKKFHESINKFLRFIESSYQPKKLSTKLSTFYDLSFSDFVKELKKQKVSLSKQDEFELMDLFEVQKAKALGLQQEIEQTDKEIDRMVYELYGLTEEEIRIVEGNVS